jgi:hypothetical protein
MERRLHTAGARYPIMKPLARTAAVMLLALATTGCVSMTVATHLDRHANFTQYRTWDWGPADELPTGDPRLDHNPFFIDHLEGALEKAMAARGFVRADEGSWPDLLVHYHASVNQRVLVNEPDTGCVPGDCRVNVIEYEQGTLMVDMIDTRTDAVVWRGWAQDSLQGVIDRQGRLEAYVDEAVAKMLAEFPRVLN